MARFDKVTFESKLRGLNLFGKRFILRVQTSKSHISRYKDAEPTQHRYSTSAAASASTGGRSEKIQKENQSGRALHSTLMIKPHN